MPTSESKTQKQEEPKTVRALIESDKFRSTVAQVLPSHLTPARFVRIAIAATTRTPKLAECDPTTVLQCLMTLSQFGLEPDGRNAHLIPFWNSKRNTHECQLIIDYRGLATLAKRSGQVSYIHADSVCDKDSFEFNKGVVVKHEVDFKTDRGKPYAYYAMVRFKDGTEQAACMTKAEVDKIKSRSRAGTSGPWVTDYDEMAKKTVFRRLSKWLELSPEFRDAIEADTDSLEELRFENALPINRPKIHSIGKGVSRLQAPSGSGSETNSDEPPVVKGDGSPTGSSSEAPSAAPSKRKLKKKGQPEKTEADPEPVGDNESQMIMRLAGIERTKEQLVQVARQFDALKDEQGWDDIGEEGFAELLFPDNWKLIEPELKALS